MTTLKSKLAVVVASFVGAFADVLTNYAQEADAYKETRDSLSAELLACILMLRADCAMSVGVFDVGMYLNALSQAFGAKTVGGRGKKADHGFIGKKLESVHVNMSAGTIRQVIYQSRAVAEWIADAANAAKQEAEDLTFRQCFNAARPPKAKAADAAEGSGQKATAGIAFPVNASDDDVDKLIAGIGAARVVKRLAAMLATARSTALESKALDAIGEKLATFSKAA